MWGSLRATLRHLQPSALRCPRVRRRHCRSRRVRCWRRLGARGRAPRRYAPRRRARRRRSTRAASGRRRGRRDRGRWSGCRRRRRAGRRRLRRGRRRRVVCVRRRRARNAGRRRRRGRAGVFGGDQRAVLERRHPAHDRPSVAVSPGSSPSTSASSSGSSALMAAKDSPGTERRSIARGQEAATVEGWSPPPTVPKLRVGGPSSGWRRAANAGARPVRRG